MTSLKFALRQLLKHPSFSAPAVLTLALGIGLTSTILSVINGFLFPPLPFQKPGGLFVLMEREQRQGWDFMGVSVPNFFDITRSSRTISDAAILVWSNLTLLGTAEAQHVSAAYVSSNVFSVLGVQPRHGRAFLARENQPASGGEVVITDGFWKRRLGGDHGILGRAINLSGHPCTIVGVMPEGFEFPFSTEVCLPLIARSDTLITQRGERASLVLVRLKTGTTPSQARTELNVMAGQLAVSYPDSNTNVGLKLVPYRVWGASDYTGLLGSLLGGVLCLLLIACGNVANLQLARVSARRKEIAVRVAMGASRFQLIKQMLAEALLLAALGGGLGLLLAGWGTELIGASFPFGARASPKLDLRVVAVTLAAIVLTAMLFGLYPACTASNPDLNETLKDNSNRISSRSGWRFRGALVVAEVALAFTLLVSGGLALKSFFRWQNTALGFNPANMLSLWLDLPPQKYPHAEAMRAFCRDALDRLENLPAVRGVALAARPSLPPDDGSGSRFTVSQGTNPGDGLVMAQAVNPDYFRALEVPVQIGRPFVNTDGLGASPVVIVNDRLARRCWPGEIALGKELKLGGPMSTNEWLTVVGVVGDTRHPGWMDVSQGSSDIYLPLAQSPSLLLTFRVRVRGEPQAAAALITRALRSVDPDQPVAPAVPLEKSIRREGDSQRSVAGLLGLFALLAVFLACVGIYGVISCFVNERTREIGIRMALGAQRSQVGKLVIKNTLAHLLPGLAIGCAVAFGLTRLIRSLLFGVNPLDPFIFLVISGLICGVGLLASILPARRAAQVDPMVALRSE